jgi:hypothetical protein
MMSCLTPSNTTITCETLGNLEKYGPNYLTYYGLGATPVSMVYSLYPQIADGKTWLNSTFLDATHGSMTYSLYNSNQTINQGFQIRNATCYQNLVNAFNDLSQNAATIIVGGMKQIDIIGGILVV